VPPWWGQPSPGLCSSSPSTRVGNGRADSEQRRHLARLSCRTSANSHALQRRRILVLTIWGLSVGGREHSKCQAPEAGMHLVGCLVGGTDRIPVAECCQ